MLAKYYYKITEIIFRSKYARQVISYLYRWYLSDDLQNVLTIVKENEEKIVIAINASEIYRFNHVKPLYDALVSDPSYKVILIGSNPQKIQRPEYQKFLQENNYTVNEDLVSYIWLPLLKPDIFLDTAITPYHQLCDEKTIKIVFAHGLSSLGFSKNHAHIKNTVTYDYILSTGPYQKRALELAAEKYKVTLPPIIRGGFIRGDVLAEAEKRFDSHAFKTKCELEDKTTILFAPTWGEFSATVEWIDPIVDLCEDLGFNLLIRLHPLMLTGKTRWETAGIDWPHKLDQLGKKKNIHICNLFSLEEYMLASDIMVTDGSSVGMEYMFLGKPVIFIPAPEFFDIFGRDKPIYWVREGLEVQNIDELKEKLKAIRSGSATHSGYDIRNISFNPGNAIGSICVLLKNLVGNDPKNKDNLFSDHSLQEDNS